MTLEDIGERGDALLCMTDVTDCCRFSVFENWFFPNGTWVPSENVNYTTGLKWDIYRTRGPSVVRLHRRRGGEEGIYYCRISDIANVTQTIYIGVYNASNGEPPLT